MAWSDLKDNGKQEGGKGGKFLSLKSGDKFRIVFRGEPYAFFAKFQDPERKEYPHWQEGCSFKFRTNVAVKDESGWRASVYEGGSKVKDAIVACIEKYGQGVAYEISRKGSTKDDTTYAVLFDGNLTPEDTTAVNGLPVLPLSKSKVPTEKGVDEIPF